MPRVFWSTGLCAGAAMAPTRTAQHRINTRRGRHESQELVFADLRQRPMTSSFAMRTFTARNLRGRCACRILRCAFQRNDQQMSRSAVEIDFKCEPIAGLSGDERTRPGHCQSCAYDLTGNVSGVCPECGGPVSGETTGRGRPS